MSRNLASTKCKRCGFIPTLIEAPRPVTIQDTGSAYFDLYKGLIVANAECPECKAKYLAWIDGTGQKRCTSYPCKAEDYPFFDLSFRGSFNDEPGPNDAPPYAPPVTIRMNPEMAKEIARILAKSSNLVAIEAATLIELSLDNYDPA